MSTNDQVLELSQTGEDFAHGAVSAALVSVFRGKFCDVLLPNRKPVAFLKDDIIYNVGDKDRKFFFLQDGFVRVGTITPKGHELIYDVRKAGDVVGELCACDRERPDRAVALEQTNAIPVPFEEIMEVLLKQPELAARLIDIFCRALKEAYAQVNALAVDDMLHRLVNVLLRLATNIGQQAGPLTEIPTVLTQEEIAQMVAARRERISTTLGYLRRQGIVQYTARGHLMVNMKALAGYAAR